MKRLPALLVALALVGAVAGGCTGSSTDAVATTTTVVRVPDGLVPPTLAGATLSTKKSEEPSILEAFSNAGPDALISDGVVYEIRRGERLVGGLQLSTPVPDLDFSDRRSREELVNDLLIGEREEIVVEGVPVYTSSSDEKAVFLWFGKGLFEVLQMKADGQDPDAIVREIITFQLQGGLWEPLPIEDDDTDAEVEL